MKFVDNSSQITDHSNFLFEIQTYPYYFPYRIKSKLCRSEPPKKCFYLKNKFKVNAMLRTYGKEHIYKVWIIIKDRIEFILKYYSQHIVLKNSIPFYYVLRFKSTLFLGTRLSGTIKMPFWKNCFWATWFKQSSLKLSAQKCFYENDNNVLNLASLGKSCV